MMQRVGIVAKAQLQAAAAHLSQIASWLEARGIEPVFDVDSAALAAGVDASRAYRTVDKDALPRHVDLVLALGGDGTLLGMAGRIGHAGVDIPILGVNFGSLGFLTEVTLPELYSSLEAAISGTAQIDERLMLRSSATRAGQTLAERLALNDVVVTPGTLSRMINLSVSVNGEFMMHLKADGLIVSSPTGSTAYNLSVGGPIVLPGVDALTIAPIAPHTLTNRPVVVPASSEIRIEPRLGDGGNDVFTTFDGQRGLRLQRGDVVTIRRAERPLRLVRASARNYFDVLREKLKWGER
jgi:NAD+ kinase